MLLRDVPLLVGSSWIEFCFSFQLRFMFHNLELIEQNVMLGKALLGISTFFHGGFFLFFLGPKGGTLQLHPNATWIHGWSLRPTFFPMFF